MNAIMAGCRAEYMPVLVAAVDALSDPTYPLELMQVTTNPMTPFLLINGQIRCTLPSPVVQVRRMFTSVQACRKRN